MVTYLVATNDYIMGTKPDYRYSHSVTQESDLVTLAVKM